MQPQPTPNLVLTTAPFLREGTTTPVLMNRVTLATLPIIGFSIYSFGLKALLVLLASVLGCLATEALLNRNRTEPKSLLDGSALLTGVLLGLTLPPAIPLWLAILGGMVAIALGKWVWGGLGSNLFNPALVGRAFLQTSFPTVMTTWTDPFQGWGHIAKPNLALPLMQGAVDGMTAATPLGMAKFDHATTAMDLLFLGKTAGSLGETCAGLLFLCGLWLAYKKVFDWRLPVATLLTAGLFAALLHGFFPQRCVAGPVAMLFSGGLLFGAVFMVTDPVTTPLTKKGMWIFGFGVGSLTLLIRVFGGLPEGVMFSILLMNAVTPLINRYTQPRVFGGAR
ncbi:MAG: RnfABCDGE type electron transport complex subunit D [Acidobacteria bacterium]|nr:RnfABCDGE type electron transport complex subunit D [Acidobacteriota bacterium]MCB9398018.1 RnfABCDGE type electron transport complex subunit D [Acidobacteriota bacterium]